MTRKEWLDSLQPGDMVASKVYLNCIWKRYSYSYTYEVHEVKTITKTGKIKLDNGVTVTKKGQLSEYAGLGMNAFYCIEPFTYEIRQHIQDVQEYIELKENLLKKLDKLYIEISEGNIDLRGLSKLDSILKDYRIYNRVK